ncbi:MAG: sulfite exporter TauE/SafE family protein [Nevskia sp.]
MDTIAIYLVTGAASGLLAGLFGVGGGLIIVPALAWLLPQQGVGDSAVMQTAIGTSLAVIGLTSIASMRAHQARGGVVWPLFWRLAPGIVAGSLIGAWIAHDLSAGALKRVVGIGALLIALQMMLDFKPKTARPLPGSAGLATAGGIIGTLSALIGIGGGSLTVPLLNGYGIEMRRAVGTSAACGVPIAWAGALGFAVNGLGVAGRAPWSLGYLDLAAFAGIAATSVFTAPLGARLAHGLSPIVLKRAFAGFLVLVGLRMLLA